MTIFEQNPGATRQSLRLARIWYALGALMLLVVAILSLLPLPDTGVSDKLAHLLTYFLLAGWFAVIARNRVILGWSLTGLIGYGMLIELLQAQTGYRYAEWADVVANTAGCAGGSMLYFTPLKPLFYWLDGRLAAQLARISHRRS